MTIIKNRILINIITGLVLLGALGSIGAFGLPLGIDFTGGALIQVEYPEGRPTVSDVSAQLEPLEVGPASVRFFGENGISIRTRDLTPDEHVNILETLRVEDTRVEEVSYTSVGPALGQEFAKKALWAILAVALAITLYVAFAFRKVSRPVPSWVYGSVVVLVLVHDLVLPLGFYALLSYYTGAAVDSLVVTALLALLGYSVNDTIVVFDRVREHLAHNEKEDINEDFEETVGKSISETLARSINTSLTTALALTTLVIFGAAATRDFALVMLVGVIAGTYSSICIAAPLLIPIARWYVKK